MPTGSAHPAPFQSELWHTLDEVAYQRANGHPGLTQLRACLGRLLSHSACSFPPESGHGTRERFCRLHLSLETVESAYSHVSFTTQDHLHRQRQQVHGVDQALEHGLLCGVLGERFSNVCSQVVFQDRHAGWHSEA